MWKDYLYFSKGERRALLILVGLLSVSLGLLIFTDSPRTEIEEPPYSKQPMSYETSKQQ
ncbi:MAG TPA: competence protein ComEA, partial [Porphyromonadaceae bacterium]|nr:competence protein ComEA [Porphyromonadaceae bacterium]